MNPTSSPHHDGGRHVPPLDALEPGALSDVESGQHAEHRQHTELGELAEPEQYAKPRQYVESSDGVAVPLYDFGGRGPTVVFCHATGFCAQVWLPVVAHLRAKFRCYALDFRGHGRSKTPDGTSMAWAGMADDLTAVVKVLAAVGDGVPHAQLNGPATQPEPPGQPDRNRQLLYAVGHSMGASSIIATETRTPGTFARAWTFEPILLSQGPVLTGDDAPEIAKVASKRRAVFPSRSEARRRYAARPPLNRLHPDALDAYVRYGFADQDDGTVALRCAPETEAAVFTHHLSGAFEQALALPMPLVAATGADDGEVGAMVTGQIDRAVQANTALRGQRFPHLSHFGPLESPEEIAVAIATFIGSATGSAPDPD